MSEMVLLGTSWKKFKMDDIFVFHKGKRLTKEDMTPGNTNFIAAIDDNNGIRQKIDLPPLHNGNCITVNYNGSIGESFYQDQPFRASDDVNILYPKKWELNKNIGLFLCTIIRHNKYRFGYGRKWNLEKMKNTNIALPVDKNGNPDWTFMDSYVEKLTNPAKIKTKIKHKELPFDTTKWKKFTVSTLFDVSLAPGDLQKNDLKPSGVPLVSATTSNNGIIGKVSNGTDNNSSIFNGNQLTTDMFCNSFYQDKDFYAVSHGRVNIMKPKFKLNKYIGLFISTVINKEQYRFAYGRAVYSGVLANLVIKLPVDKNGNPDWDYMEKYIKSLPYSDLI